ncbi:hypothetical protein FY534_07025 [Alicyclobacillus sp. TC]|nr:hypothetical protein FY534_07025 [Alicyclobacillus sp. TC]
MGLGGIILFYGFISITFYVLNALAFMNLAKLAGRRDIAWMAWVPVANRVQQLLLIRKNGAWVLILLIPIVNIVFLILWQVKLLQAYDKSGAWVWMYIFLTPVYEIMWIVWGFSDKTRYVLTAPFNNSTVGGTLNM